MSVQRIEFTVFGTARPRGSKTPIALRKRDGSLVTRPNGSPVIAMNDSSKASKEWMASVAQEAGQVFDGDLIRGPVRLTVEFFFARPQSHYGSGKNAGVVKASAPRKHTQKPDVSKLVRAFEDALTKVVWGDDAQVCEVVASKAWTEGSARAVCVIQELEQP